MAFMRFAIKKGGTTQWKKVIAFKVYFKEYIATLQLNVVLFNRYESNIIINTKWLHLFGGSLLSVFQFLMLINYD